MQFSFSCSNFDFVGLISKKRNNLLVNRPTAHLVEQNSF